jgi:hypothetical protein
MALSFPVSFRIMIPQPIEVKMVSLSLAERNAIHPFERYKGLFTYVLETDCFYYLSGGVENTHWKPIGVSSTITVLDAFSGTEQTIVSGHAIKEYLESNYVTKPALAEAIESVRVEAHIRGITVEQIGKWNAVTGDHTSKIYFPIPKIIWEVSHPSNKQPVIEAYLNDGRHFTGKKVRMSDFKTYLVWGRQFEGYVILN